MAMPKPIRLLAAATMALFLVLVIQIMRSSGDIKIRMPGLKGNKMDDMIRDPNLDGMQPAISDDRQREN